MSGEDGGAGENDELRAKGEEVQQRLAADIAAREDGDADVKQALKEAIDAWSARASERELAMENEKREGLQEL